MAIVEWKLPRLELPGVQRAPVNLRLCQRAHIFWLLSESGCRQFNRAFVLKDGRGVVHQNLDQRVAEAYTAFDLRVTRLHDQKVDWWQI